MTKINLLRNVNKISQLNSTKTINKSAHSISKNFIGGNVLSNTLLGMAVLGATMVSSCSNETILDELESSNISVEVKDSQKLVNDVNEIFNTLGLLKDDAGIENIETITLTDNNNAKMYLKPINISKSKALFNLLELNPNQKSENYVISAKSANEGLDVYKMTVNNDTVAHKNYKKVGNSIIESEYIDGKKYQTATITTNSNGEIFKTDNSGNVVVYGDIRNNEPMPESIEFTVDDINGYDEKESVID